MGATNIPKHVAIIMDGNGRWALAQGKNRTFGHEEGAKTLVNIIEAASIKGIKYLSVYAFSTENFKRPRIEVGFLMDLFVRGIRDYLGGLIEKNIKIVFSSQKEKLPDKVVKVMEETTELSKNNNGLILNVCLAYSGKQELVDAIRNIKASNIECNDIDEEVIDSYLYQPTLPPVDLVIRTSGEQRLSNYMLWQTAYAELYFTDKLWPDFNEFDLQLALDDYANRNRRYGVIK